MWIRIVFLSVLIFSAAHPTHAKSTSTTKCTIAAGNFSAKQNGKTLKCTSKKTCKTTTCKLGGVADCSTATTTTLSDCTEVAAPSSAGQHGGVSVPKPGKVMAPTQEKPKPRSSQIAPDIAGGSLAPATTVPTTSNSGSGSIMIPPSRMNWMKQ